MQSIFALLILVTCHLSAASRKIQLDVPLEARSNLNSRQYIGGNCSSTETCSECYGPGNVICSYIACFNPGAHEQCCADASYCVAANNSCCGSVGPGVTGVDGTPAITANIPQPTSTSVTSFECNEEQTGEECCQQGGSNLHWCSGSFPNQFCYNSESQICCSNGIVCDGAGCCALVSAVPTTPYTSHTPAPSGTPKPTSIPGQSSTSQSATASSTVKPNMAPRVVVGMNVILYGAAIVVSVFTGLLL